jgi:hypothetical protein
MNDCTLNPKLSDAVFEARGSRRRGSERVITPCTVTGAYIRIEFKPNGQEKKDGTLRQECDLEVIISNSGSSVKVLRKGESSGSGDGLNRMMNHMPKHMTAWLNQELQEED